MINIEKRVNLQKKNNELECLKKLEEINAKKEEKDYILNYLAILSFFVYFFGQLKLY